MGSFITVGVERLPKTPDYALELELLIRELEKNQTLQISQFCSARGLSYQGFKSYLDKNEVNIKQLRMKIGRKSEELPSADLRAEALAGVAIKLPNQVEVTIPSILPSQLSNLLRLL